MKGSSYPLFEQKPFEELRCSLQFSKQPRSTNAPALHILSSSSSQASGGIDPAWNVLKRNGFAREGLHHTSDLASNRQQTNHLKHKIPMKTQVLWLLKAQVLSDEHFGFSLFGKALGKFNSIIQPPHRNKMYAKQHIAADRTKTKSLSFLEK